MASVDIYQFTDCTAYLQAWFRAKQRRPSQAMVAKRMQCSKAQLSAIVSGKAAPSARLQGPLAKALFLDKDEHAYFDLLVELQRTQSDEIRRAVEARREEIRIFRTSDRIQESKLRSIRHWYYAAIADLAACPGFRAKASWLATRVRPAISVELAQEALDTLFELGRIKQLDDTVVAAEAPWATAHETQERRVSAASKNFHAEMLRLAAASMERDGPDERYLAALTMPIPASALPEFYERMQRFQESIIQLCEQQSDDPDVVYHLGVHLIPISERIDPES